MKNKKYILKIECWGETEIENDNYKENAIFNMVESKEQLQRIFELIDNKNSFEEEVIFNGNNKKNSAVVSGKWVNK